MTTNNYTDLREKAEAARYQASRLAAGDSHAAHWSDFDGYAARQVLALLADLQTANDKLAAVVRLCDATDIETHEATQAWLVNNIRAALTPKEGTKDHE